MAEKYEDYHKADVKLPFRLFNPDGSPVMEVVLKTGKEVQMVDKLTPEEVQKMKGLGYKLELVENKREVGIDKSQPSGDKD